MSEPVVIRCTGRPVDDFGRPVGDPCGAVFPRRQVGGDWLYLTVADGVEMAWSPERDIDDAAYVNAARSSGWSVGPQLEACCPRCRRPDPKVVRDCRAIERSLR